LSKFKPLQALACKGLNLVGTVGLEPTTKEGHERNALMISNKEYIFRSMYEES